MVAAIDFNRHLASLTNTYLLDWSAQALAAYIDTPQMSCASPDSGSWPPPTTIIDRRSSKTAENYEDFSNVRPCRMSNITG